jgi:DNA-binding MurR/RpiR family transcriptional regulator
VLILIDVFRYGRAGPLLARAARERGIDVVILCDDLCDWASALSPLVLTLPTDATLMFGPATAIHFGLDLLVLDVGEALGEAAQRQLELMSQAQETFGQYLK